MYLTAQRVRAANGHQGVNTFIYRHGPDFWLGWPPFLPEENPGTLFDHQLEVTPPRGNRVLSFLDIMAPDSSATAPRIRTAFDTLMALYPHTGVQFPGGVEVGDAWFRYAAADPIVEQGAEAELLTLFSYALRLLQIRAPG